MSSTGSLSNLRLTARFLPFFPATALPKCSRSPATLRFCRLVSEKNHQKSPRSLKVRQTPGTMQAKTGTRRRPKTSLDPAEHFHTGWKQRTRAGALIIPGPLKMSSPASRSNQASQTGERWRLLSPALEPKQQSSSDLIPTNRYRKTCKKLAGRRSWTTSKNIRNKESDL